MIDPRYDTQLLIEGHDLDEDEIRDYFVENLPGDCLLVVGDDELIKIHFHTPLKQNPRLQLHRLRSQWLRLHRLRNPRLRLHRLRSQWLRLHRLRNPKPRAGIARRSPPQMITPIPENNLQSSLSAPSLRSLHVKSVNRSLHVKIRESAVSSQLLHLLLHITDAVITVLHKLHTPLIGAERFLQRNLRILHRCENLLQLSKRLLDGERVHSRLCLLSGG